MKMHNTVFCIMGTSFSQQSRTLQPFQHFCWSFLAREVTFKSGSSRVSAQPLKPNDSCVQLTFGFLGDYLGRKKVYLVTLIIMICGTIGQCFAASTVKGIG